MNDKIEKLIKTIKTYASLEDDWDGYGSNAPTKQTIIEAITFIEKLQKEALPDRCAASGNEISFFWSGIDFFADFGIWGDGTYSYYIEKNKENFHGDELLINDEIHPDIIEKLKER